MTLWGYRLLIALLAACIAVELADLCAPQPPQPKVRAFAPRASCIIETAQQPHRAWM